MNVQAILERLGVEVVKARGGEITCRCPLSEHEHEARRPGLSVNEEHGAWICYKGCGSGSLRQLITKVKSGAEAKEILRLAGSGLVGTRSLRTNLKAVREKLAHEKKPERPIVRIPAYDRGKIPGWVTARGFTKDMAREYRLGFSEFYDALVIPVPDAHALIYRANPALDWQERPKYRYTRDFKAHSVLYTRFGFEMVDSAIILVEGPLDCLWLRQQGFTNSLSILGGGTVGIEQRRIIAEIAPEKIVLAFDHDEAGQLTTQKALHWLKRYDCYAVDWPRFSTKTDADGNVLPVKDVAELDLPDLLLMFDSPPLVQAQKIKNPLKKTAKPLDKQPRLVPE